jgi:hypothetical protein
MYDIFGKETPPHQENSPKYFGCFRFIVAALDSFGFGSGSFGLL